jgi:hypothetical protein
MHHTQPAVQFTKLYHRRVPGSSIWLHACTSCRRKGMAANDLQLPKSSSNRNSPAPTSMFELQPKKQEGWSAALTAAYLTQHRDWRVSERGVLITKLSSAGTSSDICCWLQPAARALFSKASHRGCISACLVQSHDIFSA